MYYMQRISETNSNLFWQFRIILVILPVQELFPLSFIREELIFDHVNSGLMACAFKNILNYFFMYHR